MHQAGMKLVVLVLAVTACGRDPEVIAEAPTHPVVAARVARVEIPRVAFRAPEPEVVAEPAAEPEQEAEPDPDPDSDVEQDRDTEGIPDVEDRCPDLPDGDDEDLDGCPEPGPAS